MSEPSWSDLERKPAPPKPRDPEFDSICARLLTSADGKLLIAALRQQHFEGSFDVLADERALRVRATRQHFVHELEAARDRGLLAMTKRTQ